MINSESSELKQIVRGNIPPSAYFSEEEHVQMFSGACLFKCLVVRCLERRLCHDKFSHPTLLLRLDKTMTFTRKPLNCRLNCNNCCVGRPGTRSKLENKHGGLQKTSSSAFWPKPWSSFQQKRLVCTRRCLQILLFQFSVESHSGGFLLPRLSTSRYKMENFTELLPR